MMVNWKSSEEAEAWWNEFEELKEKVNQLERRFIAASKTEIDAIMTLLIDVLPTDKRQYINQKSASYFDKVKESKDENEAFKHLAEFLREILTAKSS